jgi:hypothetical protein
LRLQDGGDARAYVIDAPAGGLATCALGLVHAVLPAPKPPRNWPYGSTRWPPTPPTGVAATPGPHSPPSSTTDGVTLYELYASEGSAPLYKQLGFTADPALMRMTRFPVEGTA